MAAQNSTRNKADTTEMLIKLIPLVLIVIAASVAAYFFLGQGKPSAPNTPVVPSVVPGNNTATAPQPVTPAAVIPLTVEQLLKEAGSALKEQRLVAPAGNNAFEFYLKILDRESKNQVAQDALRELFPFATGSVEQAINSGQLEDANRVIDLFAKADPGNYTLTILRSKLDLAKKKQQEREQVSNTPVVANRSQPEPRPLPPPVTSSSLPAPTTASAPTATPPAEPLTTTSAAETGTNSSSITSPDSTVAAAKQPVATAPTTTVPTTSPPAGGVTREVEIVQTVRPEYPRDAARKHLNGWVEIEFTVTVEGQVSDAQIINSEPPRIFDKEAVRAVQRWSFKPKMQNGQPQPSRLKRRIEFNFSG